MAKNIYLYYQKNGLINFYWKNEILLKYCLKFEKENILLETSIIMKQNLYHVHKPLLAWYGVVL